MAEYFQNNGFMSNRHCPQHRPQIREVLNEADFAVFARLRHLCKAVSDKEAIPAYSIFTNEQLAAMVTGKVDSLRKYFESIPHEHGTEPAAVPFAASCRVRQKQKPPARR